MLLLGGRSTAPRRIEKHAKRKPLRFEALWDPHCEEKNPDAEPYLALFGLFIDLTFLVLPDPNGDPNASKVASEADARTWGALQCAERKSTLSGVCA